MWFSERRKVDFDGLSVGMYAGILDEFMWETGLNKSASQLGYIYMLYKPDSHIPCLYF